MPAPAPWQDRGRLAQCPLVCRPAVTGGPVASHGPRWRRMGAAHRRPQPDIAGRAWSRTSSIESCQEPASGTAGHGFDIARRSPGRLRLPMAAAPVARSPRCSHDARRGARKRITGPATPRLRGACRAGKRKAMRWRFRVRRQDGPVARTASRSGRRRRGPGATIAPCPATAADASTGSPVSRRSPAAAAGLLPGAFPRLRPPPACRGRDRGGRWPALPRRCRRRAACAGRSCGRFSGAAPGSG